MRKFTNSNNYVKCLECGKIFKQINWNHLKKHNITIEEYINKHKLVKGQLLCRDLRIEKQKNTKNGHINGKMNTKNLRLNMQKNAIIKAQEVLSNTNISHLNGKKMWEHFSRDEISAEISRRQKKKWLNPSKKMIKMFKKNLNRNGLTSWNKGKKLPPISDETKNKISIAMIGRNHTWGNKISIAMRGKKKSKEHLKNLRISQKKRWELYYKQKKEGKR